MHYLLISLSVIVLYCIIKLLTVHDWDEDNISNYQFRIEKARDGNGRELYFAQYSFKGRKWKGIDRRGNIYWIHCDHIGDASGGTYEPLAHAFYSKEDAYNAIVKFRSSFVIPEDDYTSVTDKFTTIESNLDAIARKAVESGKYVLIPNGLLKPNIKPAGQKPKGK